jgi:hypothetical protein
MWKPVIFFQASDLDLLAKSNSFKPKSNIVNEKHYLTFFFILPLLTYPQEVLGLSTSLKEYNNRTFLIKGYT